VAPEQLHVAPQARVQIGQVPDHLGSNLWGFWRSRQFSAKASSSFF
jgi:hypothetical protein